VKHWQNGENIQMSSNVPTFLWKNIWLLVTNQRAYPGFPHETDTPKLQSKGNVEPLSLAGLGTTTRQMEEHLTLYLNNVSKLCF